MNDDRNKIQIGGQIFLSLAEAAVQFALSFKYLSAMAAKGKLKAFKSGDLWYTCEKWICEHKKDLALLLEKEIVDHEHSIDHLKKWVKKTF